MSDPILSPSEKKRLEQDEKTVMAMAAVFLPWPSPHLCSRRKNSVPNAQRLSTTPWSEHDAAPISTAELAIPAPPNAIDLPCGKNQGNHGLQWTSDDIPPPAYGHSARIPQKKNLKESHEHHR